MSHQLKVMKNVPCILSVRLRLVIQAKSSNNFLHNYQIGLEQSI